MIFCLYSSCQVRLDPYCRSFQSGTVSAHSPPRGAIQVFIEMALVNKISTHAPHARRGGITQNVDDLLQFLLTRLMRGAASSTQSTQQQFVFFYSRASCEARLLFGSSLIQSAEFLLTRLMRGAALCHHFVFSVCHISTHAPHARRGITGRSTRNRSELFLLTRLMRGAPSLSADWINFYSRASCEARLPHPAYDFSISAISTHAPHARRGPSTETVPEELV